MLQQFSILLNLLLILIIFFQVPKESIGLTSFAPKTSVLGSPTNIEKLIKVLIVLGILAYTFLCFELDSKI